MKNWLFLSSVFSLSCLLIPNPRYCDVNTPCADGQVCPASNTCAVTDPSAAAITGVSSPIGSPDGGTLTLSGRNLVAGMQVLVNGTVVPTTFLSATSLQFALPPAAGSCGVRMAVLTAQTADHQPIFGQQQITYKYSTVSFTLRGVPTSTDINATAITAAPIYKSMINDILLIADTKTYILPARGDLNFSTANLIIPGTVSHTDILATDLDGDKIIDLALKSSTSIDIYAGTNDTGPSFVQKPSINPGVNIPAFVAENLDGIGQKDIILIADNPPQMKLHKFSNFSYSASFINSLSNRGVGIVVDDFNNDQILDAVITIPVTQAIFFTYGNGSGSFGPLVNSIAVGGPPALIAKLDANLDGKLDLVTATNSSVDGQLILLQNQGSLNFSATSIAQISQAPTSLLTEDLDCDGLKDIILYNATDMQLSIYLNLGGSRFSATPIQPNLGGGFLSMALARFSTNVNKLDLALLQSSAGATKVVVYQNTSQ